MTPPPPSSPPPAPLRVLPEAVPPASSSPPPPHARPALLALAKNPAGAAKIPRPAATVVRDNPLCGDECRLSLAFAPDGTLATLAHDTRACAVCRASAALFAAHAPGRTPAQIRALAEAFFRALQTDDFSPLPPDFAVFRGIAAYPARLHCAALPPKTLLDALPPPP